MKLLMKPVAAGQFVLEPPPGTRLSWSCFRESDIWRSGAKLHFLVVLSKAILVENWMVSFFYTIRSGADVGPLLWSVVML